MDNTIYFNIIYYLKDAKVNLFRLHKILVIYKYQIQINNIS